MAKRHRYDRVRADMLTEAERLTGLVEPQFLYFQDPDKPAGQRFLGACIVEAPGFLTAVDRAHELGINPGGMVVHFETPPHTPDQRDRLIVDDAEMAALGYARKPARG